MLVEFFMRIAIIGSGALGLYYGALLQRAGNDVRFLLRRDYAAIEAHGLSVTSPTGDFHLPRIAGYRSAEQIGPVDLVLIGVKTFANTELPELLRPVTGPQTLLLTLQNGLGNEELLAAQFGAERVLGGIAFLCANRGEPGVVHHLGVGMIRLGPLLPTQLPAAEHITALFRAAGVTCDTVADLRKARWEKLVWNIPFNGLCTVTGLPTGRLLASPALAQEVAALMAEVVAAANLQGLTSPIDGPRFIARRLEMTTGMGDYRPSMLIDREEGRPLELGAIYGEALRQAAERGSSMPKVALLSALLERWNGTPN